MSVSAFPYGTIAQDTTLSASLTGDTLIDASVSPTDAEVGYQIHSGGTERSYEGIGNPFITIDIWRLSGSSESYEVRLTVDSGTAPAGSANGVWLNCATTRAWILTDTGPLGGPITNSCTVEIRDKVTFDVLATATVTMSVEESA